MKIDIITRHAIANYGSLLQAVATQKILTQLGHESEIIDYIRDDEHYSNHAKTLLKRKPEIANNPVKRVGYLALRNFENTASGVKFEKERTQLLKMTRRYTNVQELYACPPDADIFMTGSDQVWGPVENGEYDEAYCLPFTSKKKIAYAASFGRNEMPIEAKNKYKKLLSNYSAITVRENSAVQMLEKLGIKAQQVLDPTLLLTKTEWLAYCKPIKQKRYVLIYQIHNDPALEKYANKVAKAMKLPLIRISSLFHQIYRPGKFVFCPTLGQFLTYINNAECLITDSFHGTAFAINFNTPFVEVLPNNNTGTRNVSILQTTGLSGRMLKDDDDVALAKQRINFTTANQIIAAKRKESLDILKYMIEN